MLSFKLIDPGRLGGKLADSYFDGSVIGIADRHTTNSQRFFCSVGFSGEI